MVWPGLTTALSLPSPARARRGSSMRHGISTRRSPQRVMTLSEIESRVAARVAGAR
jgi:hypothetical protein